MMAGTHIYLIYHDSALGRIAQYVIGGFGEIHLRVQVDFLLQPAAAGLYDFHFGRGNGHDGFRKKHA